MKQSTLATAGFGLITKRTRKRVFLDEMNLVVPWRELVNLIQPFAAKTGGAKGGRPPFPVETMLCIHFLQQWFGLSDPAMEEALHDVSLYCEFAHLDPGATRLPDESTILRFRHLLEQNNLSIQLLATINATLATKGLLLKAGTAVDATLIAAPSFTVIPPISTEPKSRTVMEPRLPVLQLCAHRASAGQGAGSCAGGFVAMKLFLGE